MAELPAKGCAALYFDWLGLGFIFFEVVPIQQLSLFLGDPTYTLTVTWFALVTYVVAAAVTLRRIPLRRRDAAV